MKASLQAISISRLKNAASWWKVGDPSPLSVAMNYFRKDNVNESREIPGKHGELSGQTFPKETGTPLGSETEVEAGTENRKSDDANQEVMAQSASGEIAESMMTKLLHQSNAVNAKQQKLIRPESYSKTTVMSRSRFLIKSVRSARSNMSTLVRLEEMAKHLHQFPIARNAFVKDRSIPYLVQLRDSSKDELIQSQCREILALLGHIDPLKSRGVRILSIDGGGIRGVIALEILRSLESLTGRPIHQLFDYICGVSTGAVLAVLLGVHKMPIDKCKDLYKRLSKDVFNQSSWWGTGQLVLNHSYYSTETWEAVLKETVGSGTMIESSRSAACPKIAAVSAVVNRSLLQAFVFRNYVLPLRVQSHYPGSATHEMWQALRASAAAPGYFEEFKLDGLIHQDGGILMNNPAALAVHECKQLWPDDHIQCVVSLGNGRCIPNDTSSPNLSSLKTKISKIVDSATDTEGVHIILHDLLPPNTYFRFNPYLTEQLSLDENRQEKINQLENDAQMYVRRNDTKMLLAAQQLMQESTLLQKATRWANHTMSKL